MLTDELTGSHRILTRGFYWYIEVLRVWPAQRGSALQSYQSAILEARESISLCRMTRIPASLELARPAETSYVCKSLFGYLYPESRRSSIPTDTALSEDGTLIAMILEVIGDVGILHQWRLSKTTGSNAEPDRLN